MPWRRKPPAGSSYHKTIDPGQFRCKLDPKVTPETVMEFRSEIGELWGGACGRNRGIFVLDPPDGKTYDCGHLPAKWGVSSVGEIMTAAPKVAVNALSEYVSAVYNTTIVKDVSACDFSGLAHLQCGREDPWRTAPWYPKLKAPIRSVNIGGLFVLEQWILPGFTQWGSDVGQVIDQHSFSIECAKKGTCQKLKEHWKSWYSADDFQLMKKYNLNTIRLPVGYWYFAKKAGLDPSPYIVPDEDLYDSDHPITNVIRWANQAGLAIIFDLHGAPFSQNSLDNSGQTGVDGNPEVWGEQWLYNPEAIADTVKILKTMAEYVDHINSAYSLDNIIMLQLVNEPWVFLDMGMVRDFYVMGVGAVRSVLSTMPILLHDSFHGDLWHSLLKYFPYDDIFMDTHLYHGFNVADVASDTYEGDKLKMYVHERMACAMTSMLRFETCSASPVIVGEWSLAIDNCMDNIDRKFKNYGQCERLSMRHTDPWWKPHIKSFAHRQMDTYERELGWSFWAWKLDDQAEADALSARLWSFRLAVHEGLIDTSFPSGACKHNPLPDYMDSAPAEPAEPTLSKLGAPRGGETVKKPALGAGGVMMMVVGLLGAAAMVFVLVSRGGSEGRPSSFLADVRRRAARAVAGLGGYEAVEGEGRGQGAGPTRGQDTQVGRYQSATAQV